MVRILLCMLSLLHVLVPAAQDTFSIIAVDSATGEVGSAGASCLEAPNPPMGCLIISDVIPGKGAIHTQAQWNAQNQQEARGYLEGGYSPADVINELVTFDAQGNSSVRQYGIVDFDSVGHPRVAAFTGGNCMDYKAYITGTYYSIQGNILLGQYVLDSMEARFLNTAGQPLAQRLMAALQGANIPGADSRCLIEGVPAQSAFVRVAKPGDSDTALYLHLVVKSRPYGMSPIDSLQTLFTDWEQNTSVAVRNVRTNEVKIYPNPVDDVCFIRFSTALPQLIEVYNGMGELVHQQQCFAYCRLETDGWPAGMYCVRTTNTISKLLVK